MAQVHGELLDLKLTDINALIPSREIHCALAMCQALDEVLGTVRNTAGEVPSFPYSTGAKCMTVIKRINK